MNNHRNDVELSDLAAELGIEQTPEQPLSGVDFLRSFDATIPYRATSVDADHADAIREAYRQGEEEETR